MPIDKKKFLNNSFPGFTGMLLYNDKSFSVCPLTTHTRSYNRENFLKFKEKFKVKTKKC